MMDILIYVALFSAGCWVGFFKGRAYQRHIFKRELMKDIQEITNLRIKKKIDGTK